MVSHDDQSPVGSLFAVTESLHLVLKFWTLYLARNAIILWNELRNQYKFVHQMLACPEFPACQVCKDTGPLHFCGRGQSIINSRLKCRGALHSLEVAAYSNLVKDKVLCHTITLQMLESQSPWGTTTIFLRILCDLLYAIVSQLLKLAAEIVFHQCAATTHVYCTYTLS